MKKKIWVYAIGAIAIIIIALVFGSAKKGKVINLFARAERGNFEVIVAVTGELEAMNMEKIVAPRELSGELIRLYQVKIEEIVPEGTIVDSGEYVATLDKTEITTRLRDIQDEVDRQKSEVDKVRMDTTIQLRDLRDDLLNLRFELEEKQIALDQSKYEPPATIRQAQINLDKTQRSYENSQKNYILKVRQAQSTVRESLRSLERQESRLQAVYEVMDKFIITAPKKGMVIYFKERRGDKRKQGSTINTWDATVATLPDLSVMISKTFVNEIDISKISVGQKVRMGVDAFPDRKYTGEVINVSNVGEQLANSDSKVFEVTIRIDGFDPILRPYMTTSNSIVINTYSDTVFVTLEAIHSLDSIPFVYTKSYKKQIVLLGAMNENSVIVEKGLEAGEEIFLSIPGKLSKFKMAGMEFIPLIKAKEIRKKKEKEALEKKLMEQNEQRKMMRSNKGNPNLNKNSSQGQPMPRQNASNGETRPARTRQQ